MSNPNSISWVVIANSPNADPHTAAVAGSSAVQHGIPLSPMQSTDRRPVLHIQHLPIDIRRIQIQMPIPGTS